MRHLKIFEEFNRSENFNERVDYVKEVLENLKEICLPLIDSGIEISISDSERATEMIANILYSKSYLSTYNDFFSNLMSRDLQDLGDLFYILFRMPSDELYYSVPKWILDVLEHINNYMESEGFLLKITLYSPYGSKTNYTFEELSNRKDRGLGSLIRNIRIGFLI